MTNCPKCSGTRILGPTYMKLGYGQEVLRYTCQRCGYYQDEPTHDGAKASQSIAEAVCFGWRT